MIRLKKTQQVSVYQVAMELLKKTKDSPFISILVLAREIRDEGYELTSEELREKLFPVLPERACRNLLKRLEAQGYLEEVNDHTFVLTDIGEQCAYDRSFWMGEKGIYNIYLTSSPLIDQEIIAIERVGKEIENDCENTTTMVPRQIKEYEGVEIMLGEGGLILERIDKNCFVLKDERWTTELQADAGNATLTMKGQKLSFAHELSFNEDEIKSELLTNHFGTQYSNGYVRVPFDAGNTSFVRSVANNQPYFNGEQFDACVLNDIGHGPATKKDAELWYKQLLLDNCVAYFVSESAFDTYSHEHGKQFEPFFTILAIKRKQLISELEGDKERFYLRAKLETIDYLAY